LTEWRRGHKLLAAKSEEDIYAALGLPFIEPELREGRGEIERANQRQAAVAPSQIADLFGILHAAYGPLGRGGYA